MMVEIIPNRHPIFVRFTVALFTTVTGLFLLGTFAGKRDWPKTVLKATHINLWFGALATIATSLLTTTAWKGRELVYRYGMGVMSMPSNARDHDDHEHSDGGGHGHGNQKVMNFTLEKIKELLIMSHESIDAVCVDILDMVEGKIGALRKIIEDMQFALIVLERFADDRPGGQVSVKCCPSIHYLGKGGSS